MQKNLEYRIGWRIRGAHASDPSSDKAGWCDCTGAGASGRCPMRFLRAERIRAWSWTALWGWVITYLAYLLFYSLVKPLITWLITALKCYQIIAPVIQHETKMHADKVRNPSICKFCNEDMGGNITFLCRHVRVFHSRTGSEFICNTFGCDFEASTYETLITHRKVSIYVVLSPSLFQFLIHSGFRYHILCRKYYGRIWAKL